MQGLRRWLGSPHASNQLKGQGKSARKSETKRKQKTEDELIETHYHPSTEHMAQQLMDPTVPEKEIKEYHGYVTHHITMLETPDDSTVLEKDYRVWTKRSSNMWNWPLQGNSTR
ncbi:hypothetical protein SCHPADRAFT_488732 [Schizopora paradoxa]|uniref:Uncharacterized protein n=1 Tax=Schizopora paradoxa TaxID=27342 RepID=A0A0H2RNQ8_9AGAM|nr:hypothetical protein SCHPADRAFT_488732 [Schizopora paradoxa]